MIKKIMIDGMACEHCVKTIKNLLLEMKDVKVREVGIGYAEVEVENEEKLSIIYDEILEAGYEVHEH